MTKLSPVVHGIVDYLTVLLLFISPAVFKMEPVGSTLSYVLAIVHLTLTLLTDFDAGAFKIIPLKMHGLIELIVSIGLLGVAIIFRSLGYSVSFYFYLFFSVILFIVWTASEYRMDIKSA